MGRGGYRVSATSRRDYRGCRVATRPCRSQRVEREPDNARARIPPQSDSSLRTWRDAVVHGCRDRRRERSVSTCWAALGQGGSREDRIGTATGERTRGSGSVAFSVARRCDRSVTHPWLQLVGVLHAAAGPLLARARHHGVRAAATRTRHSVRESEPAAANGLDLSC